MITRFAPLRSTASSSDCPVPTTATPLYWMFLFNGSSSTMPQTLIRRRGSRSVQSTTVRPAHPAPTTSAERTVRWRRILPVKFVGGVLGLSSGLVAGREGPTIHMGASIMQAASDWLKLGRTDVRGLLAAGASDLECARTIALGALRGGAGDNVAVATFAGAVGP